MYHPHLTRNLRSLAFLLVVATVLAALGTLWWVNHTGLPETWRSAIEREISKQGAYVKIGKLSYLPLRGVIASQVRIFSDPQQLHEISRLQSAILDFDRTKLTRGIVSLTEIELKNAQLFLPLDPNDRNATTLEVTGVNGTLAMPGGHRIEIRNAHGKIAGIEVKLDAHLIGYHQENTQPPDAAELQKRQELFRRVIAELKQWQFDAAHPPQLMVVIAGDVNQPTSLTTKLVLHAKNLGKNHHLIKTVSAEVESTGDLLTVTALRASDSRGTLEGHLDYDFSARQGRFDVRSTLEIPHLLQAWLGLPPLEEVTIGGKQTIEAAGDFHLDEHNVPQVNMTGHARCEAVRTRGVTFQTVQSAFAWREGKLFLRDVQVNRPDGAAHGKVLLQWPLVRLALETTLPLAVCRPFFIDHPLESVLNDFSDRQGAEVEVRLDGEFDLTQPLAWAVQGHAKVKNVNYRGVPVNLAECGLALSHHELDFIDGTAVFNYQNYGLRDAFNGPKQGTAKVGRIRYDKTNNMVEVENVSGAMWAAPVVRLFAPKLADSLEIYRFHRPPELKCAGVVDVNGHGRTALNVGFSSDSAADYRFLGETLTLEKPDGKITIRGERVTVDNLKFTTFDGPIAGRFDYLGSGKLEGELNWTKLSIPALTSTYGFQLKTGGNVTGRLAFSLTDGRVETMNGEGLLAMEKTELFAVPIFGPLSPLVSGVLNDRRAGFQRATSAFCNFRIKNGILSTEDFQTSTTSITFVGDGAVNLKERTLDLTMRMNARGLLGLITLPLRPFYGMFQFRGTGPLKEPKWENVMFTTPPEAQKNLLLAAPKAKRVNAEE